MNTPENIHENWSKLKGLTKYGMSFIALLMTAHCGLLYLGHDAFLVHLLFVVFVMLTGLRLSMIYGLCWVHKISVVYSMTVIMCVVMRRHDIFDAIGLDVITARGIMFVFGIIICILNIWKIKDRDYSKS